MKMVESGKEKRQIIKKREANYCLAGDEGVFWFLAVAETGALLRQSEPSPHIGQGVCITGLMRLYCHVAIDKLHRRHSLNRLER
jgi:hypothetical protein